MITNVLKHLLGFYWAGCKIVACISASILSLGVLLDYVFGHKLVYVMYGALPFRLTYFNSVVLNGVIAFYLLIVGAVLCLVLNVLLYVLKEILKTAHKEYSATWHEKETD